ncbi:FAS1-like dehydratase domain-containing protein [Microbacterium sp. RD1]|uniref:FAS1-like dehydratase domain-containing protein n=1 Tax=Microbacterium sp. RD1 TaxID=3457313 RepID=UPI003FA5B45B
MMTVGEVSRPVRMDLEEGKIREFARAVQADVGDLITSEGAVRIPATFLTTLLFHEDPATVVAAMGMDATRVLHAEQEYEFHGPPPVAGTTLFATSRVANSYEKQGSRGGLLRFAIRETEFHDSEGRLVATARMTSVEPATPAAASA